MGNNLVRGFGWRKGISTALAEEGEKDRELGVGEGAAVIMAGATEETAGAGQQQIAVGDPLKLTQQCQQIGGGEEEANPWRERPSAAARKKKDKCKGNEEVREAGGEARGFGISMLCQQLEKEKWTGNETKVLNGEELGELSGGRYS